jgi:hypothetical protein
MKILVLTFWCLLPLGLCAYHYGPGRDRMALDQTASILADAAGKVAAGEWPEAIAQYENALAILPKSHVAEARQIRLELAKARMESGGLPEARTELAELSDELAQDQQADARLIESTTAALASARYFMTYLMKLEGLPDSEWEPEIEAARQERKRLVQLATARGDSEAASRHADDLESVIRLARMEPEELYGLAIPKQCSGCKSGKCPTNKPSGKPSQKPEDARGASSGPPVDGEGS